MGNDLEARRASDKAYREAHRGERAARQRVYRETHRQEGVEYATAYNKAHPEAVSLHQHSYRERHKDAIAEKQRLYRATHKEEIAERMRVYGKIHREHLTEYSATHPEYKRAYYATERGKGVRLAAKLRYRARKRSASGADYTTADMIKARCDLWGNRCYLCGAPMQSVDHVKPLAKGGSNFPCNLRPICIPCNAKKQDLWPYPIYGSQTHLQQVSA